MTKVKIVDSPDGWGRFRPGKNEHIIEMPVGLPDWRYQVLLSHEMHHAKQFNHIYSKERKKSKGFLPCFKSDPFKKAKKEYYSRLVEFAAYGAGLRKMQEVKPEMVESELYRYAKSLKEDSPYQGYRKYSYVEIRHMIEDRWTNGDLF